VARQWRAGRRRRSPLAALVPNRPEEHNPDAMNGVCASGRTAPPLHEAPEPRANSQSLSLGGFAPLVGVGILEAVNDRRWTDRCLELLHGGREPVQYQAAAVFPPINVDVFRKRCVGYRQFSLPRWPRRVGKDGMYIMAGPCDLTPDGAQALMQDRRLGPRPGT
jgi:hypothetical protein